MAETILEWFTRALAVSTREEADAWLVAEVLEMTRRTDFVENMLADGRLPTAEAARELIRHNLGYMTGYYGLDVAQRILELFDAEHPIFGKPAIRATFTPKDAFAAGQLLGERSRQGERDDGV